MPRRILIIRLSAVGDTILNLPILCALRNRFPDSQIGWVVSSGAADLLRNHECLDRLFVLTKEDQSTPLRYLTFLRLVRDWRPEVTLDAQGLTKSALIAWFSGANQRFGLASSEFEGRELSTWLNNRIITPTSPHVIDRGLALLEGLGIRQPTIEYRVPEDTPTATQVAGQATELGLSHPWAMINVGAGWPSKIWPAERYATVAKHLHQKWNLKSLIAWGGNKELAMANDVASLALDAAVVAPKTTLMELANWIRRSSLFIGSDTGPMHLAVAVNTPTVGLIGPMPAERVGPRGPFHATVQNASLPPELRHARKSECGPMLSISVDEVCAACDRVLESKKASSGLAA
jgi:lipopolysaccharide heptosyltransferase I